MSQLELWGGVECTVNRVGDRYFDQCERSGHCGRPEDLELFRSLGVTRLRYPFLWEKAAPQTPHEIDWSWADERAEKLRELGLSPIAGFVHHGSGPRYTNLIDEKFPELLAAYARAFAERFPWISAYTPINEPLTTARFSTVYGHWYPHARDDRSFVRAILIQSRATVLAMREVRAVHPGAWLVQTEDLGFTTGTARLQYQIDFENERRWLSYDLLCGKVNSRHPLYAWLRERGAGALELAWFEENRCPPSIVGVNHYLLSSRYLDHRLEHFPEWSHGGNGKDSYADVGAVDTPFAQAPLPAEILCQAWERYRLPVAVTEAHVNGTRESQLRWLNELWRSAMKAKSLGADMRAVTAWSLLGSFDWNQLCVADRGFYESGVFDLRAEKPRPTALVQMVRSLASKGSFVHPVLQQPGWWRREPRSIYRGAPILITGAHGTLGRAFARICERRGLAYRVLSRADLDIADRASVERAMEEIRPWAVINAAGYVRVDEAERDRERCFRENVRGPELLAEACSHHRVAFLSFSSDLVFNGRSDSPYLERHATGPMNVYGESKAHSEQRVLELHPQSLVVRTSSFFGPWDRSNFVTILLERLAAGSEVEAASDLVMSPTYVPDLVNACLDLLIDGETGIVHLTNRGSLSWAELAHASASLAKRGTPNLPALSIDLGKILPRRACELSFAAARPRFSVLGSERARILPSLDDALDRYFFEIEVPILSGITEARAS